MKKLLFLSVLFLSAFVSFGQKPDFIRTPNGPNTIVDWNLKAKTFVLPHGTTVALNGSQDTTGNIYFRVAPGDTSLNIRVGGVKWWNPANYFAPITGGGYVPTSRTLTIFGSTQDLSTNRTFTAANLTNGFGINSFSYNGSSAVAPSVDTANIVTKTFAGRYALQSGLGSYLLKSDSTGATGYVRNWYLTNQLALKANLAGGNNFTGNQTMSSGGSDGLYIGYGSTGGGYVGFWNKNIASKVLNNAGLVLYPDLTSLQSSATVGTVEINIGGTQKFAVQDANTYVANTLNLTSLATGNTSDDILVNTAGVVKKIAGSSYLTPTGSAAGLTGFPTLNQNTTGSAATLTTTRTIWGQNFNGSANVSGPMTGVTSIVASSNITAAGTLQGNGLTITGATNPALQINSGVGGYSRFTFSENSVNKYLFGYNHTGSDGKFGFFDYGSNTWGLYWNGTVDGNTTLFASNARPDANNTFDLGSSSFRWKDFYSGTGNFSGVVTGNSFVKPGGTSSQFLMADGSVNSNSYATTTTVNSKADSVIVDNPTGLAQGIASQNASFLLLTDSFGLGAGASTYNKGFSSIVTQSIQNASGSSNTNSYGYTSIINMQYQLSSGTGITTTGSLVNTGLVEKRLELTAGETITITNRTYRYADVFYDASLSSGTLTFRLNGNIVATKTLSGTGIQNTSGGSSTPMVALETLPTDTLTITASATAIVTAIIVLREPTFSPPITYVASQGATLFSDYTTSAKMDEIAYYLNYASRERRYVGLALGTNSIYSAYKETPASMIANAATLIAGINSRSTAPVTYILIAPSKANETYYPTLPGYTYEDYIKALVTFCDSAHYELIRYDLTPMGLGSDTYMDDHLHPNDLGHSIIANAWTTKLNIPTNPNTTVSTRTAYRDASASSSGTYTPTLTPETNVSATSSNVCMYTRVGNMVTVSGYVSATPTAASTNSAFYITLPVASNLGAATDVAGVGQCYNTGNITNITILADSSTDQAFLEFKSGASTSSQVIFFNFTYRVI